MDSRHTFVLRPGCNRSLKFSAPNGDLSPWEFPWAAQVAGLDRTDFLLALSREGVDVFAVGMNSLRPLRSRRRGAGLGVLVTPGWQSLGIHMAKAADR
jgi:hypothetical protein